MKKPYKTPKACYKKAPVRRETQREMIARRALVIMDEVYKDIRPIRVTYTPGSEVLK